MNFQAWQALVKSQGGWAVVWPFKTGTYAQWFGFPAARYDAATYVTLGNSAGFDVTAPQEPTADNAYFYVLAPQTVAATAPLGGPGGMSLGDKIKNAVLTTGDNIAEALHLPSLAGLEHLVLGIAAVAGVFLALEVVKVVRGFQEVI